MRDHILSKLSSLGINYEIAAPQTEDTQRQRTDQLAKQGGERGQPVFKETPILDVNLADLRDVDGQRAGGNVCIMAVGHQK